MTSKTEQSLNPDTPLLIGIGLPLFNKAPDPHFAQSVKGGCRVLNWDNGKIWGSGVEPLLNATEP